MKATKLNLAYNKDLEDFQSKLESFDWHYPMTDDPRVYWNGERSEQELKDIAKRLGPDAITMYMEYRSYKGLKQ